VAWLQNTYYAATLALVRRIQVCWYCTRLYVNSISVHSMRRNFHQFSSKNSILMLPMCLQARGGNWLLCITNTEPSWNILQILTTFVCSTSKVKCAWFEG
jgi:hypothetical protein